MRKRVIDKSRANIGAIVGGCDITGISGGDFSFVELIEHCAGNKPCNVVVSAWTAAAQDIERVATWQHNVRLILDTGFVFCKPDAKDAAKRLLADEQMRFVKTHCKFSLIERDGMKLVVRTSMNLNLNPKAELYSVTDSAELYDHFMQLVDAIFATCAKFCDVKAGALDRADAKMLDLLGPLPSAAGMTYEQDEQISYA